MLMVRDFKAGDSPYLDKLDHQHSEFPYANEDWKLVRNFFQEWVMQVIEEDGEIVGFFIAEEHESRLIIHRIIGLQETALFGCERLAVDRGLKDIEYSLPECSCRGGSDPYDMSAWLLEHGFKCEETIPEMFKAYGELVDGYIFRKKV